MANSDVKLLGAWASPFAVRPMIAFQLKSVGYEYVDENLDAKSQLLLQSNPIHKKVPVLIHGGRPICESLIIVEYIDEVWSSCGPSILPPDPYDRATARFWGAYIDTKLFTNLKHLLSAEGEEKQKLTAELIEGLVLLQDAHEKISKGKAFFGGDEIDYIDIALGSLWSWFKAAEKMCQVKLLDEAKIPSLLKWAHLFTSHPSVKDVDQDPDKLVEFGKAMVAKYKAAASS